MFTFACACGQRLQVPPDWAGRKVRCPTCQAVVVAIAAAAGAPGPEVDEQPTWSSSHDRTVHPKGPAKPPDKKP